MKTASTSSLRSSTISGIPSMRTAFLAAAVLAGANLAHASGAAPSGSGLTTYSDLDAFLAATAGITFSFENFAAHDSHNVSPCYEPVNRDFGQPGTSFLAPTCFYPGDVIPGFDIRSDLDWTSGITNPWGPMTGPGLFFVGALSMSPGPASNLVGATYSAATKTFLDFRDAPTAVAMDAYDVAAGSPVTIDAYAAGNVLIGSFTVFPATPMTPSFAGFTSTVPIKRVVLHSASAVSQMLGNLRFGGTAGKLEIGAQSVDLGTVAVGSASSQSITVSNGGNTGVAIDPVAPLSVPFSIASDDCSGTTLAPGASCSLTLGFAPALERTYAADLTIVGDGDASDIDLRGRGVLATLSVSPSTLTFPPVPPGGSSGPLSLTLGNASAVAVDVSALDLPGAPFALSGGSCAPAPFTLAPGQSCTLTFTFSPTHDGHFGDRVSIASNDPSSPGEAMLHGSAGDVIFADGFDGSP